MIRAGAQLLVDLRAETLPTRYKVPVAHFPLEDGAPGQEEIILEAASRIREAVQAGQKVGIFCQAGVSRTAAVGIAYLMLEGESLAEATAHLRSARPQALPAMGLWHSLEEIERRLISTSASSETSFSSDIEASL